MDLFNVSLEDRFTEYAPLAARMRPTSLDEVAGQQHLLAPGRALRTLIHAGDVSSIILWGPAGAGKTTLANVIASAVNAHFESMSAVTSGVADVRKVIEKAKERLGQQGAKTLLFLDEIHRFNKAQQDALLPAVENGWIVLVGATTENPSFEVNSPLMSRSLLFRLEALSEDDLLAIERRALTDAERGLAKLDLKVDEDALEHIARGSGGDARAALNALEAAAVMATATDGVVTLQVAEEALQRRALPYDKAGDWHYDVISAFIKSMRGSDPDAAVYWMARMLDAGEDPRFVARRMVIFASEDVGNADPTALQVAVAAHHALEFVGLPEAKLNLVSGCHLPGAGSEIERIGGRSVERRRGHSFERTSPGSRPPARLTRPGIEGDRRGQGLRISPRPWGMGAAGLSARGDARSHLLPADRRARSRARRGASGAERQGQRRG